LGGRAQFRSETPIQTDSAVNLAEVPPLFANQLAAAVTGVVSAIPGQELVAVDLV
jgi:hypothetical protein